MPHVLRLLIQALPALVAATTLVACQRPTATSEQKPIASMAAASVQTPSAPVSAVASAVAAGAPLAKLVPPSRPGPRASCPLTIEPGVGFGPVLLGETLADLARAGLKVKQESDSHAKVELTGGAVLGVSLCQGKIIDIWLDDLRKGPDCVMYAGKPVARTMPRADLEAALGGCEKTEPRTGGSFERCQQGGVYVGHGMGEFVQIRVRPREFAFDDTCAIASDDGSLVEMSAGERVDLLKKVLLLRELSSYWHVDKPGRDPLRIVKTPLVRTEPLTMFGSPVVWIDEAEARPATAFLRLTKLEATKTKATAEFAYPIEGVKGVATFRRSGNEWRLEKASVAER